MTDAELQQLLDDLESDRVERKESAADGDKIRQAICAFANDLPGHDQPSVLFVGVDDDGRPNGMAITDQLENHSIPTIPGRPCCRSSAMPSCTAATRAPTPLCGSTGTPTASRLSAPVDPTAGLRAENFGEPGVNDYRNPHLAEARRILGFAQRFGVGIQIAREALARNGNPPPEFRVEPWTVFTTIRRTATSKR